MAEKTCPRGCMNIARAQCPTHRPKREVIHDPGCGVPTDRTWACACNERNGYRDA